MQEFIFTSLLFVLFPWCSSIPLTPRRLQTSCKSLSTLIWKSTARAGWKRYCALGRKCGCSQVCPLFSPPGLCLCLAHEQCSLGWLFWQLWRWPCSASLSRRGESWSSFLLCSIWMPYWSRLSLLWKSMWNQMFWKPAAKPTASSAVRNTPSRTELT